MKNYGLVMRRHEHSIRRRAMGMEYEGGRREENLREDGWTVWRMISEKRDCRRRKCTTVLHGGVYRHTSTPYKSRNKVKGKKKPKPDLCLFTSGCQGRHWPQTFVRSMPSLSCDSNCRMTFLWSSTPSRSVSQYSSSSSTSSRWFTVTTTTSICKVKSQMYLNSLMINITPGVCISKHT